MEMSDFKTRSPFSFFKRRGRGMSSNHLKIIKHLYKHKNLSTTSINLNNNPTPNIVTLSLYYLITLSLCHLHPPPYFSFSQHIVSFINSFSFSLSISESFFMYIHAFPILNLPRPSKRCLCFSRPVNT